MHLATEICELKGTLVKKSDTRYAVSVWYIPGGCEYDNAQTVVGFWSEEEKVNAEAFQKKYEYPPTLAVLIDLTEPDASGLFRPKNSEDYFALAHKASEVQQHCWIDTVKGNQSSKG